MSGFVLDASITMAWHFVDERRQATEMLSLRASRDGVIVPRHWHAEVTNCLLTGERRGRTTANLVEHFIARLKDLAIELDAIEDDAMFDTILPFAKAHRLTVYDALYLELAYRRGLPLATLDTELIIAAGNLGVVILGD